MVLYHAIPPLTLTLTLTVTLILILTLNLTLTCNRKTLECGHMPSLMAAIGKYGALC